MLKKSASLDGEMRSSIYTRLYLISAIIVLLFVFLIIQIQIGVFSASRDVSSSLEIRQQSIMAILKVSGNQSISVNSTKAIGPRVMLGSIATLDIAPNTTVEPEFDHNGAMKATLTQGCVILRAGKDTEGEVVTSRGIAGKTNSSEDGPLEVCFPQGAWPGLGIEQNHDVGLFYFARLAAFEVIGGRLRTNLSVGLDERGSNPGPSSP